MDCAIANNVIRKFGTAKNLESSVLKLLTKMQNLDLSEKSFDDYDLDSDECLAGYIKAIIQPSKIAVIQLSSESRILDAGTTIFVRSDNCASEPLGYKQFREIGRVLDIFGSVMEPMYSLQLNGDVTGESLKMNSKVFYFPEHSSTKYINVLCDERNRYTVSQE